MFYALWQAYIQAVTASPKDVVEVAQAMVDPTVEVTPYMLGYLGGNPRFTPPRRNYVSRTRQGIGTGKYK